MSGLEVGARVLVRLEVHTAAGLEVHACPCEVLSGANPAGLYRVRFSGEAAARFGLLHWVAAADVLEGGAL